MLCAFGFVFGVCVRMCVCVNHTRPRPGSRHDITLSAAASCGFAARNPNNSSARTSVQTNCIFRRSRSPQYSPSTARKCICKVLCVGPKWHEHAHTQGEKRAARRARQYVEQQVNALTQRRTPHTRSANKSWKTDQTAHKKGSAGAARSCGIK